MKFKFVPVCCPSAVSMHRHKTQMPSGRYPVGVLPPRELRRVVAEMVG